jgi:hypothetical protein
VQGGGEQWRTEGEWRTGGERPFLPRSLISPTASNPSALNLGMIAAYYYIRCSRLPSTAHLPPAPPSSGISKPACSGGGGGGLLVLMGLLRRVVRG